MKHPEDLAITAPEDKFGRFVKGLIACTVKPPSGDPLIATYAEGLLDALHDPSTGVRPMIVEAIVHTDYQSTHAAKKPLDWYQFTRRDDDEYPSNHTKPDAWKNGFTRIAQDKIAREEFTDDFVNHVIDTNRFERKISVPLTALLYPDTLGNTPSLVDYFSSKGLGGKHLAGRWGFPELNQIHMSEKFEQHRDIIESQLKIGANHFPSMPFSSILNVDFQPEPTLISVERTKVSSHTPSEWAIPANRYHFDALVESDPPGVDYAWNVDMRTTKTLARQMPKGGFSIGMISNGLYFYEGEVLEDIIDNSCSNLAPDGKLIVQEFGYPDTTSLGGIRLRDNWFPPNVPFPYQTMIFDKADPEAGFKTLYSFPDSRPNGSIKVSDFAAAKLLEIS